MSTTALDVVSIASDGIREIGRPLVPGPHLFAHPGTNPTITVPVLGAALPDVDDMWSHLSEPADFFGIPMPTRDALGVAVERFCGCLAAPGDRASTALTAVTVTVVALGEQSDVFVTGTRARSSRSEAVRIDVVDTPFPLTRPADPHWRRMAARTTSKADVDQLRRWLDGRGFADGLGAPPSGVPFLGALLFGSGGELFGADNAEPTSLLDQLRRCGVLPEYTRVDDLPGPDLEDDEVWWISPHFEFHPVAAIGSIQLRVAAAAPSLVRLS